MSKTSKIMVVAIFLFSILFLVFSLKAAAKIQAHERIINSLNAGIAAQNTKLGELGAAAAATTDKIELLRSERDRLTTDLAQTRAAKEEVDGQLSDAQNEISRLEGDVASANEKIASLESLKQQHQAQISELSTKLAEVETKLTNEVTKSTRLLQEVARLRVIIKTHTTVQQVGNFFPDEANQPKDAKKGRIIVAKPIGVSAITFDGHVAAKKGSVYEVLRGDQPAGTLTIGDVYYTILICRNALDGKSTEVQKGDLVKLID
jgi:septal ring factor EnvC (AmiA/AmiB activator)